MLVLGGLVRAPHWVVLSSGLSSSYSGFVFGYITLEYHD